MILPGIRLLDQFGKDAAKKVHKYQTTLLSLKQDFVNKATLVTEITILKMASKLEAVHADIGW